MPATVSWLTPSNACETQSHTVSHTHTHTHTNTLARSSSRLTREGGGGGEDPEVAGDAQRQDGRGRSQHRYEQALLPADHVAEPPEHRAGNESQQPSRAHGKFCIGGGGNKASEEKRVGVTR